VGALSAALRRRTRARAVLASSAFASLAACGAGTGDEGRSISISDAWALAAAAGQPNGAVYFTITSVSDDVLERAAVSEVVADHAELHEAVTTATGAMGMQEMRSGVPLPPGTAVTFAPGGMHVMLVDLTQPLVVGETFDIVLEFADADPITLPVAVVESGP
jgi:copper(I)-binding protein